MDTWILAQRDEAVALHRPGEIILVGPRHLFDRVSPRLLITDQSALRHALYPYMRDDANRQKLASLYQRLAHGNVAGWQQSTEQVIDHIAGLVQAGTIAAMAAPDVGAESGMPPAGAAQTPGAGLTQASGLVSQWSLSDRFAYVLQHAPDTMAPALRREFSSLLDPTSLAVMAGALALWAASHAVGAGEVIDVVLLAVGYAMAGWAIFDALGFIVECITDTVRAKDIGDLDHAAQALANATAKLGAGVIIALLTRVAGRVSKQVGGAVRRPVAASESAPAATGAAGGASTVRPLNPGTRFYVGKDGEILDANTYARNSGFRSGVRDKAWDAAVDPETGVVNDPLSGVPMDKSAPWDMGHKPGMEYWKERDNAINQWLDDRDYMTRKEFLDRMNDPSRYRPELPSSNRSHLAEDASDLFWK